MEDGEVRELGRGQRLTDVGMRADCWNIREAVGTAGVTGLPGPDPDGFLTRHCEVAGAVEWTRAPSTVLLRVNGFRLIAEPSGVREVRVRDGEYALERYLPDFWLPRVGSRVSVHCQLSVMADYEWDAFEFPDVRADWVVERIQVEHRVRKASGLGGQGVGGRGEVIRVGDIQRMRRWADDKKDLVTRYLLDVSHIDAT